MSADGEGENVNRRGITRRGFLKTSALGVGLAATDLGLIPRAAAAAPGNVIVTENAQPGTTDDWDIWAPDNSIEGFATEYSINAGERQAFKIRTDATNYEIKIYRLGWYGGIGARNVATIQPSATLPQTQPEPFEDTDTGLIDCGNWAESASWDIPANAVSGIYVANFEALDGSGARNRTYFVVRNDGRSSDILVQTSDTTYQAYNYWGGSSLYFGYALGGRGVAVSYNRPYNPGEIENDFFYGEYPLVRWLERNGYDVSYCGCVDTATRPAEVQDHKVFVSSGHDEYWSGSMRTNVEAARDAGVHLIFMTGNEIFWRIRFENSPTTSGADKTIVCYKETLQNAKVDPSPEWTGTWRDGRFTPPALGGANPENALTGTLFKAINPIGAIDFAIKVPSTYASRRFWRNTSVAGLAPGTTATLSDETLGYEWNTDADNGARPAGLIRLSETTEVAAQVLQDNGGTYIQAPLTHYMTMYKAPSGALVWSTGTVQWAWGLDEYHSTNPNTTVPTDVRIQQATVNTLADMDVQPATMQAELTAATKSTDTTAPSSLIQSPPDGSSGPVGTPVTISGTASDVGGVVAAVEVSTDGGATWHPADGTTSWSYSFVPSSVGPTTILSRAVDDSCNLETPGTGISFNAENRPLPASIWPPGSNPTSPSVSDTSPVELGVRFRSSMSGFVTAIRFYKGAGNTGTHVGRLWSNDGQLLGSVTFTNETASGWQTARFDSAIAIAADQSYVASYTAPNGGYAADAGGLADGYQLAPLEALAPGAEGPNGVYGAAGSFPNSSFGSSNYWVDIEFDTDNGAAPAVAQRSPADGVSAVSTTSQITAVFTEAIQPGTAQMDVSDPSGSVSGSTSYDAATNTLTFTPDSPLDPLTAHTVAISDAQDFHGETMTPVSWGFTTAADPGDLPSSIWTSDDTPDSSHNDSTPLEIGVRFVTTVDGIVVALRYYQVVGSSGASTGRLWDLAGNVLGTATFGFEPGSGWREAPLDNPVQLAKDTTYVASYNVPDGRYGATSGEFLGVSVTRGPLVAPSSDQVGGNGVYRYGSGFPTLSFNGTNYWADIVMEAVPDVVPAFVTNVEPGPDLQAVSTAEPITVTFDGAIDPATVTFDLQANGSPVSGTLSFPDPAVAQFTPDSPLAGGTPHQASVFAADVAGNAMTSPYQWSFTTATPAGATPASLWTTADTPETVTANDSSAIELGVKFKSSVSGAISAIRFYRGPGNDGPHVGHLWDSQGTLLGSVNFSELTAVGWQQANFDNPIPVTAGATYVASYHAPNGRYSVTSGGLSAAISRDPLEAPASATSFGNGVFRYGASGYPNQSFGSSNYWIDVIFIDNGGPSVEATSPGAGASNVAVDTALVVTFSEPVSASAVTAELRDGAGALVPITVSQAGATQVSIQPDSPLATSVTYTATIVDAQDAAGNGMSAPHTWSFTTIGSGPTAWTLFDSATPATPAANDPSAIELGTRFQVTENVDAEAIRFYRGPGNVGPHIGRLWLADGTLLAEVNFADGGPDGWQVADLATPVALAPGQTYVVSYFTPSGNYAVNGGYFNNGDVVNGPLTGLGTSGSTPNGLFNYGGGFPTGTYNGGNYWVDVRVATTG